MFRRLLHISAMIALLIGFSWSYQSFQALYFVQNSKPVELYGKILALSHFPKVNRLSIWMEGAPDVRWDLFLDNPHVAKLLLTYQQGESIRIAGYPAGDRLFLLAGMESEQFKLNSEAVAKDLRRLRAKVWFWNVLAFFLMTSSTKRLFIRKRSKNEKGNQPLLAPN